MARIGNDRMIVQGEQREDTTWLFTICYTACFSESDIGQRFDDSVTVGEAHAGDHSAFAQPVAFTATSPKVFRKKRIVLRDNTFDHENRHEAVCAWIRLRASAAESVDDEQRTPALVPMARTGRAGERIAGLRHAPAQSLRC